MREPRNAWVAGGTSFHACFAHAHTTPRRAARLSADVAELADRLGHERLAVVGVSAGAPYAPACAHDLPQRVTKAGVVSSTPWACAPDLVDGLDWCTRAPLRVLRRRPRACTRIADALLGVARRHPRLVAQAIGSGVGDVHAHDEAGARFLDAAGGGVGALVDDYGLCVADWGFHPADVRVAVQLWHGAKDPLVPVDQALLLAAALPRAEVAIDADEGHFFYRRRLREILGRLVGRGGVLARMPADVAVK